MSIHKLLKLTSGLAAAAIVGTTAAAPLAAQGGVELTPWAGVYVPTSNSVGALDQDIERDVSVAGGLRLSFWGTGALGFEVTGGYAPAKIADETINETGNTDLLQIGRAHV